MHFPNKITMQISDRLYLAENAVTHRGFRSIFSCTKFFLVVKLLGAVWQVWAVCSDQLSYLAAILEAGLIIGKRADLQSLAMVVRFCRFSKGSTKDQHFVAYLARILSAFPSWFSFRPLRIMSPISPAARPLYDATGGYTCQTLSLISLCLSACWIACGDIVCHRHKGNPLCGDIMSPEFSFYPATFNSFAMPDNSNAFLNGFLTSRSGWVRDFSIRNTYSLWLLLLQGLSTLWSFPHQEKRIQVFPLTLFADGKVIIPFVGQFASTSTVFFVRFSDGRFPVGFGDMSDTYTPNMSPRRSPLV